MNAIMQLPMWNKDAKQKCQVFREDNGKATSVADSYLANLVKDNWEVADNDSSAEMTDYSYALYPLFNRPGTSPTIICANMCNLVGQEATKATQPHGQCWEENLKCITRCLLVFLSLNSILIRLYGGFVM